MHKSNAQPTCSTCWHNGQLIALADAKVSILDHGLLYGDGLFEGLRFYNKRPFKIKRHLERLRQSAKALAIALPFAEQDFIQGVENLIAATGLTDGYLRILVTRGEGNLGLNPSHCAQANCFIVAASLELMSEEQQSRGLSLVTVSTKRATGTGLDSRIKSLNYLHSILAKTEANHAGADDALLLNQQGTVAECSAANIFIVKAGQLSTPPCTDGALEGITRETVIELAEELGIPCTQRSMTPWDIYNADECFITGSAARLLNIACLDGRAMAQSNGPIFSALSEAFFKRVREA